MLLGALMLIALGSSPLEAAPVADDGSFEQELVESIPAPIRFGRLSPVIGRAVQYQVTSPKAKAQVRAALTRRIEKDGKAEFQYEFDVMDPSARMLVVVWVSDAEKPVVTRLALWVPPQPPISVPIGLFLGTARARGVHSASAAKAIAGGPFAGEAVRAMYRTSAGKVAEVVESARVPLFGVQSVKWGDELWVATGEGSGAESKLLAVPLVVPRMPSGLLEAAPAKAGEP